MTVTRRRARRSVRGSVRRARSRGARRIYNVTSRIRNVSRPRRSVGKPVHGPAGLQMPQWPMPMAGRPRRPARAPRLGVSGYHVYPPRPRRLPAPPDRTRAQNIDRSINNNEMHTLLLTLAPHRVMARVSRSDHDGNRRDVTRARTRTRQPRAAHPGSILLTRVNTPTSRSIRARQIEACTEHIHNRGSDVWGAAHHTGGRPHPRDPPVTTHSTHSVDVHGHDTE